MEPVLNNDLGCNLSELILYDSFNSLPEESIIWHTYKKYTSETYQPFTIDSVLDYRIKMVNDIKDPKAEYTEPFYIREISGCDLLLKLLANNEAY